ncbi:MAG: SLATT domain-containing protein [Rhodanobacter sp.]
MIATNLERLQTDAWRTAGARYNASRRLRRRDFVSTVSMALFSAATVAVAYCQKVYAHSGSPLDDFLTTVTVCLGVFLLAVSLIEWGSANGAKAEALYQNAENLNAFHRQVRLRKEMHQSGDAASWDEVLELTKDYEAAKRNVPHNHKPLDDLFFVATHRRAPEFQQRNIGYCRAFFVGTWWFFSSIWYLLVLWFIVAGLLIGAFFVK